MYETVQALKYAHKKIGCLPKILQTDNGLEFTDKARKKDKGLTIRTYDNYLEVFLKEVGLRIN